MTPLTLFAISGCLALGPSADRITLADLAPAFPGWRAATDTPLSFAPAPGVSRIFGVAELRRIAARFRIDAAPPRELCLVRPVTPLSPDRLLAAMRRSLPEARIEIVDYLRVEAPAGELEFPASALRQTPSGAIWNGAVRYAGNRRFPMWAKVKVAISGMRVTAAVDLAPLHRVEASQLRVEQSEFFPGDAPVRSVEEIAGRVLRRAVRAGTPLRESWFDAARDVERGDRLKVEVRCGGARLEVEAEAQASGSVGQVIPVRNEASKKCFRATVEGKGRASVGL